MIPANDPEPAHEARPLILIVDDIFENRSSVQRRLTRMGYDCLCAEGGREALEILMTSEPAVILLDYMMPEMSGLMVLQRLRASTRHASTPVIMLTARTDGEAIVESLKEGADDYVHKPIDFAVLKARIDLQIERYRERRDLIGVNTRMEDHVASRAVELGEIREMLSDQIARNKIHERQARAPGPDGAALNAILAILGEIELLAQPAAANRGDHEADLSRSEIDQKITDRSVQARKIVTSIIRNDPRHL